MKRSKINPPPNKQNSIISIGEDDTGDGEQITYSCPECHRDLVKLSDRQRNNQEWFCKNCSISFPDIEQVQTKQKLTNPHYEEIEPAVSTINLDYSKDVEIRHPKELRGGMAELAKKGHIKVTYYEDSSQR